MRTFKDNRVFLIGSWTIWLVITALTAVQHFRQPDFPVGMWAIPAVGFLLCLGVVIWALLESDKDFVWQDMPPAQDDDIETAKESLADAFGDGVALVKKPSLEIKEGTVPPVHSRSKMSSTREASQM